MNTRNFIKIKNLIELTIDDISSNVIDFDVDSDGDESDKMQATTLLDVAYAQKTRNMTKLNDMLDALYKINNNDYGCCEECGNEIPTKRLEIFLDAKYCISCAETLEKI